MLQSLCEGSLVFGFWGAHCCEIQFVAAVWAVRYGGAAGLFLQWFAVEKSETRSPGWTIVRDARNKDVGVIGGQSSLVSHDTSTWGCVFGSCD